MSTTPKCYTRFELMDTTGRVVVHCGNTQSLEQDECRTLKVFIDQPARVKDAERIEQLEALCRAMGNGLDEMMRPANRECDGAHCTGCWKDINGRLVKLLFAAGFKPSEP